MKLTSMSHVWRRVLRLFGGVLGTGIIWCGLLPRLLEIESINEHVTLMEERNVDPSAMFYTELDRLPLPPAWIDDVVTLWP